MTIHEAVISTGRQPLLGGLFLLLTGQMALVLAAFRDGRSRRVRLSLLIPFLFGAVVMWFCLSMISWEINYPGLSEAMPAWLLTLGALPVRTLALAEAVMAVLLVLARLDVCRYRKNHVTQDSVKQAMDLLPVGVAFGRQEGAVLFRNLVMNHLSQELTGKLLNDLVLFQEAAGGGLVSLEDGVWQLFVRETPGMPLLQITAAQITGQARILRELEEKNKKLKDIQLRLKIYSRQTDRIIIAQELLTARMAVHDELGSVLLESRHYMSDPASIDETLLLQALKNTNMYLLREYEKDDAADDPLAEAFGTAEIIGVKVALTGIPPESGSPRLILAAAVRECATNTVKHAEGDCLAVDVRRTEEAFTFTLSGNGRPPAGEVRETGGLLSLRTLVESQGGAMCIDSAPAFCLRISVPGEGR